MPPYKVLRAKKRKGKKKGIGGQLACTLLLLNALVANASRPGDANTQSSNMCFLPDLQRVTNTSLAKRVKQTNKKKFEPFFSRIRECINCYVRKNEATHSPSIVARESHQCTHLQKRKQQTPAKPISRHTQLFACSSHTPQTKNNTQLFLASS